MVSLVSSQFHQTSVNRLGILSVCGKCLNSQYKITTQRYLFFDQKRCEFQFLCCSTCLLMKMVNLHHHLYLNVSPAPLLVKHKSDEIASPLCMQLNKLKRMSKRIKEKWKRAWAGESVRMNTAVGRGQLREAHCLHIESIVTQLAEHSKSDISPLRFQIKICPLCEKHEQSKRWAPHFSHYQTRATHISALNNYTHTCHMLLLRQPACILYILN